MRHDLFILVAIVGLTLAVVVPQAVRHGFKAGLLAFLGVLGLLATGVLALLLLQWLTDQAGRPESGWRGATVQGLGHLSRFLLVGVLGVLLAAALVAGHGLTVAAEDLAILGGGTLAGSAGCLLHHRLGPARFWPACRRLAYALLGSLAGGLLGLLAPGTWGVPAGILIPLGLFAALAAAGKIVPPCPGPISISSPPDSQ